MLKRIGNDRKLVISASLFLLIVSLTQPAFFTTKDNPDAVNLSSVGIFFLGWMGFLGGAPESFFWFANPLFIVAIILFARQNAKAIFISSLATILAISFLTMDTFFANEGGGRSKITGYGMGYILWVSSLSVLSIGILITMARSSLKA
jgi:hypothetical protein